MNDKELNNRRLAALGGMNPYDDAFNLTTNCGKLPNPIDEAIRSLPTWSPDYEGDMQLNVYGQWIKGEDIEPVISRIAIPKKVIEEKIKKLKMNAKEQFEFTKEEHYNGEFCSLTQLEQELLASEGKE